MKRILITGASGFIGSRLTIRAAQAGHEVIATARRVTPPLEAALGQKVLPLDVLATETATREIKADVLFHCATANDILSRDFAAGVNLSVQGAGNVLEGAGQNQIPDIIFFSTLQVYGTELEGRIMEDTPPRCESAYGLNHLLGEEVCRFYANRHGLNVVLLRPANVYGVPDAPTVERSVLVPMCFVKSVLKAEPLVLLSSGRQQRNFISTDEVADACLHLVENFPTGTRVINAGSHWLASIREIAEMVSVRSADLKMEIRSEKPERSNHFILESSLAHLRPSMDESCERMCSVITRLFEYFAA